MMLNKESSLQLELDGRQFDFARKLRARIGELPGNIPLEGLVSPQNRALIQKFPALQTWKEAINQPDISKEYFKIRLAVSSIARDRPRREDETALVTVADLKMAPRDRLLGIRNVGPVALKILEIIFK